MALGPGVRQAAITADAAKSKTATVGRRDRRGGYATAHVPWRSSRTATAIKQHDKRASRPRGVNIAGNRADAGGALAERGMMPPLRVHSRDAASAQRRHMVSCASTNGWIENADG